MFAAEEQTSIRRVQGRGREHTGSRATALSAASLLRFTGCNVRLHWEVSLLSDHYHAGSCFHRPYN